MTSTSFYEEGSKLLTPGAFEFVLDIEIKRALRSQTFLTLVTVETTREWEGMMVTADEGTMQQVPGPPTPQVDAFPPVWVSSRAARRPELLRLGARPAPPQEPSLLVPEIHRLRDEARWRPRFTLNEALSDTIAWWRGRLLDHAGAAPHE